MSEPNTSSDEPWGWLQWIVVAIILVLAVLWAPAFFNRTSAPAPVMRACNNARQIAITLKSYAGDHGGKYPEGATANDAFRELFRSGLMDDERAFGGINSPYIPDNNFGWEPDFKDALQPGENHWAMTKGLTDSDSGNAPLIFENPAVATWPPYWDDTITGKAQPGRTWKNGKIIVVRNDGSVNPERIKGSPDGRVTLEPFTNGKNLFEQAGPHEIMDVARRPTDH